MWGHPSTGVSFLKLPVKSDQLVMSRFYCNANWRHATPSSRMAMRGVGPTTTRHRRCPLPLLPAAIGGPKQGAGGLDCRLRKSDCVEKFTLTVLQYCVNRFATLVSLSLSRLWVCPSAIMSGNRSLPLSQSLAPFSGRQRVRVLISPTVTLPCSRCEMKPPHL